MNINEQEAIDRVLRLMAVPGKSCEERLIAEAVIEELRQGGVTQAEILFDDAHERTPSPGQVGNLIARLPGTTPGPTILLSAHLDTVPICVGCQPTIVGDHVQSADPKTGLGADNRAGVAALVTAAIELTRDHRPHGPVVLCWFVQEEIGLQGSRSLDPSILGDVDIAVNFDGGTVEKLTIGATGGERMTIEIFGHASHAGIAPEAGVNAITIAAVAIEKLRHGGWLGRVEHEFGKGTSNIGIISGGDATNVVTPYVKLRAEARSHDSNMRTKIVEAFRQAFQDATEEVRAVDGRVGHVSFQSTVDYDSFRLPEDAPSVLAARQAIIAVGRTPYADIAGGGLDANWLFRHGISAVTLGCGQRDVHTVNERLCIADYLDACRIALRLACGTACLTEMS